MSAAGRVDRGAELLTPDGIRDPYRIYAIMREEDPVHWSDAMGSWVVSRYHDVKDVYRANETFSNVGANSAKLQALPAEVKAQLPMIGIAELRPGIESSDPPTHTRLRAQVIPQLTPRKLASHRDGFAAMCEELADGLAAQDEPDLLRDFSYPLAYATVLGLFGAPARLGGLYEQLAAALMAAVLPVDFDLDAALHYERTLVAFRDALESVYEEHADGDDGTIIGALLHPAEGRPRLDRDEMFTLLKTFLGAALENLYLTIPTTMMALLQSPEQWAMVKGDPALFASAYEETLRWSVPGHINRRIVVGDTELGGRELKAGQLVTVLKASANHDPEVWDEPARFDLTRKHRAVESGHMAFGQGIHFCAGAGLARLQGPLALRVIAERFPDMRLHDGWEPVWQPFPLSRKLSALPVELG